MYDSPDFAPNNNDYPSPDFAPEAGVVYQMHKQKEESDAVYYDAITSYYNYKQQYEQSKEEIKRKISKNESLSNSEKRKEYLKKRPKCINCSRAVGTIFKVDFVKPAKTELFRRTLIAKCGDKVDPCNLDIQITLPYITVFEEEIDNLKDSINQYKLAIIRAKNDVMFGYLKDDEPNQPFSVTFEPQKREERAVEIFRVLMSRLTDETKLLEMILAEKESVVDGYLKNKDLITFESELESDIKNFDRLIEEYSVTKNEQFLKESALIYKDNILKKTKQIMDTKYSYCEVEYDENDNVFKLVQKAFPLNDNQYIGGEEVYQIVNKFVKTDTLVKANKTLKRKPSRKDSEIMSTKTKTRKYAKKDQRIAAKISGSSSLSSPTTNPSPSPSPSQNSSSGNGSMVNSEVLSSE